MCVGVCVHMCKCVYVAVYVYACTGLGVAFKCCLGLTEGASQDDDSPNTVCLRQVVSVCIRTGVCV